EIVVRRSTGPGDHDALANLIGAAPCEFEPPVGLDRTDGVKAVGWRHDLDGLTRDDTLAGYRQDQVILTRLKRSHSCERVVADLSTAEHAIGRADVRRPLAAPREPRII